MHRNHNYACAARCDMDNDVDRYGHSRRNTADWYAQRDRHGYRPSANHFLGDDDDVRRNRDCDFRRCGEVSYGQRNRSGGSGDLPSVTCDRRQREVTVYRSVLSPQLVVDRQWNLVLVPRRLAC